MLSRSQCVWSNAAFGCGKFVLCFNINVRWSVFLVSVVSGYLKVISNLFFLPCCCLSFNNLLVKVIKTPIGIWHVGSLTLKTCADLTWCVYVAFVSFNLEEIFYVFLFYFLIQYFGITVSFWLSFGYILLSAHLSLNLSFAQAVRMPMTPCFHFFCLFLSVLPLLCLLLCSFSIKLYHCFLLG